MTLQSRFDALTHWLLSTRPLWRHRAFVELPAPWEASLPDVAAWLCALPVASLVQLEQGHRVAGAPPAFIDVMASASRYADVPDYPVASRATQAVRRGGERIKARKAAQIAAFAPLATHAVSECGAQRVVDWCAGKGHLGRAVAVSSGKPLALMERDESLCTAGHRLADAEGVPCVVVAGDVHGPGVEAHLTPAAAVIALHACGTLMERLIQQSALRRPAAVVFSSCCYHRGHSDGEAEPLSARGRAGALRMTRSSLLLPTLDEGAATQHVRQRRHREQVYRLALDLMLRESTGEDRYRPLGGIPRAWFDQPFAGFARQVAGRESLPLPSQWDGGAALKAGQARADRARALGALRAQFRRPIELWLVLDRALRLEEAGYHVSVGTFCDATVTPRNLAVVALRR